jgi:alcohol dehydrogenase
LKNITANDKGKTNRMEDIREKATRMLHEFKGENYVFGTGVFHQLGVEARKMGVKVSVVVDGLGEDWVAPLLQKAEQSLFASGLKMAGPFIKGARSNAPREDVAAITEKIKVQNPDVVVTIGGGSTIDAVKAAIALHCLGDKYPAIDDYFGTGQISGMLARERRRLLPHLAVMTAASSAAHLTKYSNITDIHTGQKMLIVDEAVIPSRALFDYSFTTSQPRSLTVDGALDGISHSLEVMMGISESKLDAALPVCLTGIELIVNNIKQVVNDPQDVNAREAVGLGTDLGGYSIMIGGTNGAHLNSFSMTDILSHGRACALMNPYYVVFFSTVIGERLKKAGRIYQQAGYIREDIEPLNGREMGLALAKGMIRLSEDIGFPTTLKNVPGYTEAHKKRCLQAAKDPKLDSKLKNMPVPLSAADVDEYMGSVLDAAESGDMEKIKNM